MPRSDHLFIGCVKLVLLALAPPQLARLWQSQVLYPSSGRERSVSGK